MWLYTNTVMVAGLSAEVVKKQQEESGSEEAELTFQSLYKWVQGGLAG